MNKQLSIQDYVTKNYAELFLFKAFYKIYETAKSAKKSSVFARSIIIRLLSDKRACVLVLRKYAKDHRDTTLKALIKAFDDLEARTGYDWKKYWTINAGKDIYFANNETKQRIYFGSFDRYDSLAGLEPEGLKNYFSIIWLEEPIQQTKKEGDNLTDDELILRFESIKNTCFRGITPIGGIREILISYNDWDPFSKFKETYITPYVQKDEKRLLEVGKQFLYDPNAFNGLGLLYVCSGAGVNEFTDEQTKIEYKNLKQIDYNKFKCVVGGCGMYYDESAYGENLKLIQKINANNFEPGYLVFGIDYSSKRDKTVIKAVILSTNFHKIQIIDQWEYDDKRVDNDHKLTDPQQVEQLWKFIEKTIEKNKNGLVAAQIKIWIDSRDTVVRGYLTECWKKSIYKDMITHPLPASKFGIAGNKIRVAAVRALMGMKRIYVAPHIYKKCLSEWNARIILKNGNLKDGNDDGSQAFEYSISSLFNKIFTPTQQKHLLQMKNVIFNEVNND